MSADDPVRNTDVSAENGQPVNPDVKIDLLLRALDSFRWLGNNLHNITESPDWFRAYYEAALEDAEAARAAVWADRPRPKR